MLAFVAGALVGAIMGLTVQAYWMLVLAKRPLESFKRPDSPVRSIIMFGSAAVVGGWVLVGGGLGVLIGVIKPDENDAVLVPSVVFLMVLLFLSTIVLIPALAFLRRWKWQIFVTFIIFTGLFGLLLPNLVVAAQK